MAYGYGYFARSNYDRIDRDEIAETDRANGRAVEIVRTAGVHPGPRYDPFAYGMARNADGIAVETGRGYVRRIVGYSDPDGR